MPRKKKTPVAESKDPKTSDVLTLSQLCSLAESLGIKTREEARALDQKGLEDLRAQVNSLVKFDDDRVRFFFTQPLAAAASMT